MHNNRTKIKQPPFMNRVYDSHMNLQRSTFESCPGLNFSSLPRYYLSKAYNCENHALKIREKSVNDFYDKTSPCAKSSVKSASRMGGVEILPLLLRCSVVFLSST